MSTDRCVIVIAGVLEDRVFNHICFIAESLSTILPNFYFRIICKSSTEWKPWLKEICGCHCWCHNKSPIIWREIGLTRSNISYIGGSYQFWELLHKYYNISSHLTKADLDALQEDFKFAHDTKSKNCKCLNVQERRRRIMIIGAGRSVCPMLVAELILIKELWLTHGIAINLYDEPGCFFKLRKILKDAVGIGGGLNTVNVLDNIPDGLNDCDILIYLDVLQREESEGTESWLQRNYTCLKELSIQINQYAPSHMKVIFCSMGPICFYVNVMHTLVTKLPKTSIVAVSSHYGLEYIYVFSLGFTLQNFGCPPVWGYLGINHFVDVHHMIQKSDIYQPNRRALDSNENATLPIGIQHSELRWFFYMTHNKLNPYKNLYERKSLAQYQVGRSEDTQKSRAICDLLKLWYSKEEHIGDEIISLGISSDGSFGIPKGLVFSQPVYLKVLEDHSRVWVPFRDFPMPNMSLDIFQNLIETANIIKEKITELKDKDECLLEFQENEET